MALYTYRCQAAAAPQLGCSQLEPWDVSKPMAEYDRVEYCPHCKRAAVRHYTPTAVHFGSFGYNANYGGKNPSSK